MGFLRPKKKHYLHKHEMGNDRRSPTLTTGGNEASGWAEGPSEQEGDSET
jgi:hypothetical protein